MEGLMSLSIEGEVWGGGIWRGGSALLPRNFFNFCVSNCIFWCIVRAILSAALLLDILHFTEVYQTEDISKTYWNEKFKY